MLASLKRLYDQPEMAIELDANFFPGFRALGVSLAGLKRYEEATEALKTCAQVSSRHPLVIS
jgi:hypothetical protein